MLKFILPFVLGLPIFVDLNCFNIYPFCFTSFSAFSLVIQGSTPIVFAWLFHTLATRVTRNFRNLCVADVIYTLFFVIIFIRPENDYFYVALILLQLLPLSLLLLDYSVVQKPEILNLLSTLFIRAAFIAASSSIIVFIFSAGNQYQASQIIYGYLNYWNDYTILLFGLAVVMKQSAELDCSRKELSMTWSMIFMLIFMSTVFSGSRSSLIFALVLFFGIPISRVKKLLASLVVVSLIVPVLLRNERLYTKFERILVGDIYSGRDLIWGDTLNRFMKTPFFGIDSTELSSLHSTFAEIIFFVGLFWLPVVASIIVLSFYQVYRIARAVDIPFLMFMFLGFFLGPFAFNAPLRQLHIYLLIMISAILVKSIKIQNPGKYNAFKINFPQIRS